MNGRELKQTLAVLMRRHRIAPIERAPLPLLPPTAGPQIISGVVASADLDAERMTFAAGSISWGDLSKVPLVLKHSDKVVGRLLALDYRPDGQLLVRAEVNDHLARQMPAFSIAATVTAAEPRHADSVCFRFDILAARLDHVALTDAPANLHAIVTARRDVTTIDRSHDEVLASVSRVSHALEELRRTWGTTPPAPPEVKAAPTPPEVYTLGTAPGVIYGDNIPQAMLTRSTSFGRLVCRMQSKGD